MAALARDWKFSWIPMSNSYENILQVPHLSKAFPLFFRERATFLPGFWDHWLQHAPHLHLPEADEAAGDEFTGAGEWRAGIWGAERSSGARHLDCERMFLGMAALSQLVGLWPSTASAGAWGAARPGSPGSGEAELLQSRARGERQRWGWLSYCL